MADQNLALWENYGKNVLMMVPYFDTIIVKTEGLYYFDANNRKILDFNGGAVCSLLGHNHPKLSQRLKQQLDVAIHTGVAYLSLAFMEAAKKLSEILPGNLDRVALFSTGAEANEIAIKMAKVYTQRTGVMGFDQGHLGATHLLNQIGSFNRGKASAQPLIGDIHTVMTPDCAHCPVKSKYPQCDFLCLKKSTKKLGRRLKNIAAMLVEPILPNAGVVVPPPGYFKALKSVLDKYGILLIVDEAKTAFGRTGKWFAIEHHDVTPDILVCSKTAGGGYPVSIVAAHAQVEDTIIAHKFHHVTSHMNDPLGAEAISAVIDIVREENLLQNAEEQGNYLLASLKNVQAEYPQIIGDIRGQALMVGIEIKCFDNEGAHQLGYRLAYCLIEDGLNVNWFSSNVLIMEPPLTITRADIDSGIQILRNAIQKVMNDKNKNKAIFKKNAKSRHFAEMLMKKPDFKTRVLTKLGFKHTL
ncbi:MAG: aspartate aminotransferase family protein [bacterium]